MILIVSENQKDDLNRGDTVIANAIFKYLNSKCRRVNFIDKRDLSFFKKKIKINEPFSTSSFRIKYEKFKRYEFVIFVGPNWLVNYKKFHGKKFIYYTFDNFHLNLLDRSKNANVKSIYYYYQSILWKNIYKKINSPIIFVHEDDYNAFNKINPKANSLLIPNGIENKNNNLNKVINLNLKENITFGFFGSLDSLQSYKAIIYLQLINKSLVEAGINATIKIWGARPNKKTRNIMKENKFLYQGKFKKHSELKGQVDLFLFPLYGTGIKNRVLECIDNELPFLTSSNSLANIHNYVLNNDLLIRSENVSEWIDRILLLKGYKKQYIVNVECFTWNYHLKKLNLLLC